MSEFRTHDADSAVDDELPADPAEALARECLDAAMSVNPMVRQTAEETGCVAYGVAIRAMLAFATDARSRGQAEEREGGHADTEGEAMAMFAHLNCPACGGSGHIEDAAIRSGETPVGEGRGWQAALVASLAKRSQPTMDPPYTAAFNAALDMVARDMAAFLSDAPVAEVKP